MYLRPLSSLRNRAIPMEAKTELDKTIENLACSGRCAPEEVEKYREKLEELAKESIDEAHVATQSKLFKALGDKTRLRMIYLLRTKELCVCEIMAALNLTQPTASHHLGILENAGIVKDRKEGKWVFYSIAEKELVRGL